MIVNNSRRFIFVHVPKTAGTSATRALSRFTTFRDLEIGGSRYGEKLQDLYASRFDLRKHSTAREIREKAGPEVWRGFFVFAFSRDPYARAYSIWKFLRRWKDGPHYGFAIARSFEDFIASEDVRKGEVDLAKPQAHWLCGRDGRLINGLDFVGRLECFEADLGFVLSTIERRPTKPETATHANASAGVDEWREALSPAAQAAIEDVFAVDFDLFGYKRMELRTAA